MRSTWKDVLILAIAGYCGASNALPRTSSTMNVADYPSDAIITRDVCIIGGGSTGTYSAVHLGDMGKSVIVVESKDRLGGHTETYTDPTTNATIDIGVEVWHNLEIVKEYFARFNVPLVTTDALASGSVTEFVDYRTGKIVVDYTPTNFTDGLVAYAAQLAKYPSIESGFYLPDPIPEDLLLPFGDFIKKYMLESAVNFIFNFAQGLGDLLRQPTLYVFKNFGSDILRDLEIGFLTTARRDNSELYEKARAELGSDVLLNSAVLATDRSAPGQVKILVKTPSGTKLILAKKMILTIPPKLDNLVGFDLDANEVSLFAQFKNSAYYTGLLRDTAIPGNLSLANTGADTLYNVPVLPGVYAIRPTGVAGLHSVKYGSPVALSVWQVQQDILASVKRMEMTGTLPNSPVSLVTYSSHTPFELTVSTDAIRAGFYTKLYALQGQRNTFYTGAAFHTHDSSLLWQFTQTLLTNVVGNLTTV
ncbi:hypothetical protein MMC06_006791 [Schaereria dolodes]|nr:hypothetical protein [Schaereria dolodes]